MLVCDNWSIHKTSKIANFLTLNLIPMLNIPPYSPWLNAAEIMIKNKSEHKQAKKTVKVSKIKLI